MLWSCGRVFKKCWSFGSSSSMVCTSLRRSRLILASWRCCIKPTNCSTGLLSCPIIYCMAIMAPRVIWPFTTAVAAKKVIKIFLPSLINKAPTCWYCCRARPFMLSLNSCTWRFSQSQRLRRVALLSFNSGTD